MELDETAFILAIIALCYGGWLINNWIRAKHGYALEDEWGGKTERTEDDASKAELKRENAALRGELQTVHDRVAVLERIVTDKGYGLSEQIEALRDQRAVEESGVPIDVAKKEKA